jgi:uncharacterized protein YegL
MTIQWNGSGKNYMARVGPYELFISKGRSYWHCSVMFADDGEFLDGNPVDDTARQGVRITELEEAKKHAVAMMIIHASDLMDNLKGVLKAVDIEQKGPEQQILTSYLD